MAASKSSLPAFYRLRGDTLLIDIKVAPGASQNAIDGPELRDDGSTILRLRVTAPPDKGKANKAVIALLAKALNLPKSSLSITAGETARFKTIAVENADATLISRLGKL